MTNNIIYKATVTTSNTNDTKHYIGMTATTFKERYAITTIHLFVIKKTQTKRNFRNIFGN
jgi:hypothetical protein